MFRLFGYFLWIAALPALTATGCSRKSETPYYSATAFAPIVAAESLTEGKLAAISKAETDARNQILRRVLDMKYPSGESLEQVAVTDAFIRAKIYDTIRSAHITDKTISEDNVVTVTVRLELEPILKIIDAYPPETP